MAISPKSLLLILNLIIKKAKLYIKEFEILKTGFYKIIKLIEKNKSEPRPDLIKKDQALSLLENINHFVDLKNLKKKLTSNSKPKIKLILIKKLFSWS